MKKIIILTALLALVLSGCSLGKASRNLTLKEAKTKAAQFINSNLMNPGSTVTIKDITQDLGMYKVTVILPSGQEVISYMTKDGKKFFPQIMDVAETEKQTANQDQTQAQNSQPGPAATVSVKKDKPEVELFVMSYCPYGTQIEKGILPVLSALGNKIKFDLKFCDYSMHGDKELAENMTQTCIEEKEPAKLDTYLGCFLKNSDSSSCLSEAKIDTAKIDTCVSALDKQYKITETAQDKSKWPNGNFPPYPVFEADNQKYGVQGSPTLVINGEQIQSDRDSESLLTTICSAFTKAPAECQQKLSSTPPSPGFGEGAGSAGSAAGCAQ